MPMPEDVKQDLFGKIENARTKAQQKRTHTCHWPGCKEAVRPAMWGCRFHWYSLPRDLRNAIWRNYRPGQEVDKRPSPGYIAAAREVQEWIAREHPARVAQVQQQAAARIGERDDG
jgi:hypothetical protein